jgi:hypothetical protein
MGVREGSLTQGWRRGLHYGAHSAGWFLKRTSGSGHYLAGGKFVLEWNIPVSKHAGKE